MGNFIDTNTDTETMLCHLNRISRDTIGEIPEWTSRKLSCDFRLEKLSDQHGLRYVFIGRFGEGDRITITILETGEKAGPGRLDADSARFYGAKVHLMREGLTQERSYRFHPESERFHRFQFIGDPDSMLL